MSRQFPAAIGVCGLFVVGFLWFCFAHEGPPDDHDNFYTGWVLNAFDQPGPEGSRIQSGAWAWVWAEGEHPRLASSWLLAWLRTAGPDAARYRLGTLPFVLALLLGVGWVSREMRISSTFAVLAVLSLPVITMGSRKWDIQFPASSVALLGVAALARGLTRGGWAGVAFASLGGCLLAVATQTHLVVLPQATLAVLFAAVIAAARRSRNTRERRWAPHLRVSRRSRPGHPHLPPLGEPRDGAVLGKRRR